MATGARPRVLPGIEPDGELIWTYFEAMVPKTMPKSLIVMGSGAIGIEFASFYRSMGAEVTVVELMPQIMPGRGCREISKLAQKQLEKAGTEVLLEAKVTKVEKGRGVCHRAYRDQGRARSNRSRPSGLSRRSGPGGNIENLGLEALGVKLERGTVVTDGYGRTSVEGIYAIGGRRRCAHARPTRPEHEGVICVEKIAGVPGVHALDKGKIPGCTYCHPQVASVGLTEARQGRRTGGEGRPVPSSEPTASYRAR